MSCGLKKPDLSDFVYGSVTFSLKAPGIKSRDKYL